MPFLEKNFAKKNLSWEPVDIIYDGKIGQTRFRWFSLISFKWISSGSSKDYQHLKWALELKSNPLYPSLPSPTCLPYGLCAFQNVFAPSCCSRLNFENTFPPSQFLIEIEIILRSERDLKGPTQGRLSSVKGDKNQLIPMISSGLVSCEGLRTFGTLKPICVTDETRLD